MVASTHRVVLDIWDGGRSRIAPQSSPHHMRLTREQLQEIERRPGYAIAGQAVIVPEKRKRKPWSAAEDQALRDYYANTPDESFSLKAFGETIGRSFASLSLRACRLGITGKRTDSYVPSDSAKANNALAQQIRVQRVGGHEMAKGLVEYIRKNGTPFKGRKHSDEVKAAISLRNKAWHAASQHPRGMLGKKHTQATKDAISMAHAGIPIPRDRVERGLKTRAANGTLCRPRPETTWKSGWVEIGGKRFYARSRWEANYARYLQWQKERGEISDWSHEPKTFWFEGIKRGCVSYLPDFCVQKPSGEEYHEVKGWMDDRSKTKIARMGRYYPEVNLVVIDSVRYRALAKTLKLIIKGWE